MKIQSISQDLSSARSGARSFSLYTLNNEQVFQQYFVLERFETQLSAGQSKGLIIYDHPARVAAGATVNGEYNGAPLRQWIDEAKKVLGVIRRYRRKMLVIERGVTEEPYFKTAFAAAFGGRQPPQGLASKPDDIPAAALLTALFAVRQYRPVADLLFELEASGIVDTAELPLDESLGLISKELHARLALNDELEAAKHAYATLESQFDRSQSEIDSLNQKINTLERETEYRAAVIRDLSQKNEAQEKSSLAHDSQSNEILMRQILDLETSVQQLDASRRVAEARVDELQAKYSTVTDENAELKKAINLIRKSTSWRMTAPIRGIKSIFSR